MKAVIQLFSFVAIAAMACPVFAADRVVIVGRTSVVPLPGPLLEVDNRKPSVASVEANLEGDSLLISGNGEGLLRLRYTLQNGRTHALDVQVLPFDLGRIRQAVLADLDGIDTVDARYIGGSIVLDGEVALAADIRRLENVSQKYDSIVVNEVALTRVTLDALALAVRREIAVRSIRVLPDQDADELVLAGTVSSKKAALRAERIAKRHHHLVRNDLKVSRR